MRVHGYRMAAFIPQDLQSLITLSIRTLISINLVITGQSTEACMDKTNLVAHSVPRQFSSTDYPLPYKNNEDKCWVIQAESSDKVVVAEIKDMDIEASLDCRADHLQFRDGKTENSTSLANLCGKTVASFSSTQNHLFIRFTSDHTLTDKGFQIEYYSVQDEPPDTILEPDAICDTITFLTATTNNQNILSPDFPQTYRNALDTCWSIETEKENFFVRIQVMESQLEYANPCSLADYVQVRDGPETTSSLLAEWCGQQVPSYITSTNSDLLIRFRSNNERNQYTGFKIRYWAVASSSNDDGSDDMGLDSTGRVMLGVGVLITFALVVSAFVYHKKYSKRRPNAVSNLSSGGRRHSRGNVVMPGPGMGQRMYMPGGVRGVGAATIGTPNEPGVYPAYSAPAQPAYGPYGAPPMPPGMIIAPPPYSATEPGGSPLGPPPPDLGPMMTLDPHATPPPSYDDIIKDDPPLYPIDPPNYINSEAEVQSGQSADQSRTRTESNSSQNNRSSER